MNSFIIEGGVPLRGEVQPGGNKNAALPLMAATLLTDEPVILDNVPEIRDVHTMRALLESMGVQVREHGPRRWEFQARDVQPQRLDAGLCRSIRASILLAGPMLARSGGLHLPPPGGDVIGRRRVDTHILALEAMGARAEYHATERQFVFTARAACTARKSCSTKPRSRAPKTPSWPRRWPGARP